MQVDIFDFKLPEEQIALEPIEPRENARLLYIPKDKPFSDLYVKDLPDLFNVGDVLVFNDTKVIHAQLNGVRKRGKAVANIAITLHMRISAQQWRAFARPAKRLKTGDIVEFYRDNTLLKAWIVEKNSEGEVLLQFDKKGADLDAAIAVIGDIPLPPYIALKRGMNKKDESDYQTIYARNAGAVAAPTAGLHFTDNLMQALKARGIEKQFVTLYVGAGTFLPVKVDDTINHKMHAEIGHIDEETANRLMQIKARGGRIVAVGTTALRLLESASDENGQLKAWSGSTDIFITPGYKFRFVDCLMTNFHLPRSTLFMLVSAFSGINTMRPVYEHAIQNNYRFYSYGDTSLLDIKDVNA